MKPCLTLTALACGAALVLSAPLARADAPASSPAVQQQTGKWAQDYLARPADPAIRFGTLANGMRYAIMRNERPEGAVSMRLRIGSGDIEQPAGQLNVAHFLEHMAFRGSTNVPDGEVKNTLDRLGLTFGADTNAETGFDHTVFKFDFPHADEASIDTGLKLLREIGGRLNIDPALVDAERGVLLSENRVRANPAVTALQKAWDFQFAGTTFPKQFLISDAVADDTTRLTAAEIRAYYQAHYRPDNATLVIAGAIDPAAIEAKIKAQFADWTPAGPPPSAPDYGAIARRGAASALYAAPGVPDQLSLSWVRPYDTSAETDAFDRREMLRQIGIGVLNRRLATLAQGANPPFGVAQAQHTPMFRSADATSLAVIPSGGKWREALAEALRQQRLIARDGVSVDEARAIEAELRAGLVTAASGAATRENRALVDMIVANDDQNGLVTSPAQDLAFYDRQLPGITLADINAELRALFAGSGPLLFRSTPDAGGATPADLDAALAAALSAPIGAATAEVTKPWPYDSFGAPGRVVERRTIADLGITLVRFANGTRLAVKPTAFTKDNIEVRIGFGGGRRAVTPALAHAVWTLQHGEAFVLGGTKQRDYTDIEHENEGRIASMNFGLDDDHDVLSGATRPADFARQMQLLTAYVAEPALRDAALDRIKGVIRTQLPLLDSVPTVVFTRDSADLRHGGNPRWHDLPTIAEVDATSTADLHALLDDALAGDVTVSVVGDVTVDEAIAQTARTFGAIARQHSAAPPADMAVSLAPATAQPVVLTHRGQANQGVLAQLWPMRDFYAAPKDADAMAVAARIIDFRLWDGVREKLGLTYTPQVMASQSPVFKGYGFFAAVNEVAPANMDTFARLTGDAINALAAAPPSADEFARATKPLAEARDKAVATNPWWVGRLDGILHDPRAEAFTRSYTHDLQAVTPAAVSAVVKTYLAGKAPLTIEVVPAAK